MPPYVIYARKSTESEDRQVLSIQSQIAELQRVAAREGVPVAEVLTESKSAKAPGRPVFGSLLARAAKGQIGGVLCWKMDRLARNHFDTGQVLQALADGKLERVITSDRIYTRDGNDRFMGTFEFAAATKFIDDLRANVKRGMRARIERGWACNVPPIGYRNDRIAKTIVRDPERFDHVRRLWELLLTGTVRVEQIRQIAEKEMGLRSRFTGRALCRAALYRMFANPFYMGMISLGERGTSIGSHPPMVTREEFDRARSILRRPGSARPQKREFAYTGMVRCGVCGRHLTGEMHCRPNGKQYVYYRCAGNHNSLCRERTISERSLDAQLAGYLARLRIPSAILGFLEKHVAASLADEVRRRATVRESLKAALAGAQREEQNLLSLRLRDLVDDAVFLKKRTALRDQRRGLEERVERSQSNATAGGELVTQILHFSERAQSAFTTGTLFQKKMILEAVSANTTVRSKKVALEFKIPFSQVADSGGCHNWIALVDYLRTWIDAKTEFFALPDLGMTPLSGDRPIAS